MKRSKLYLAGLLLSGLLISSCGREGNVATPAPQTTVFAKTQEMLNFENSLKLWMKSKHENQVSGKSTESAATEAEAAAKALLVSLGKTELTAKANQSTDELMRTAMQEYSKKLTEMNNQQQKH